MVLADMLVSANRWRSLIVESKERMNLSLDAIQGWLGANIISGCATGKWHFGA